MNKKSIDINALNSLTKNADVLESGAINDIQNEKISRKNRLGARKTYRSFSLSLAEEDYLNFLDYLDNNNISSGSAFIRDLLKEKKII